MKLLNILGAVVALHIAVLVLAIAIPGCRSTDRTSTSSGSITDVASESHVVAPAESSPYSIAPEMTDLDLNPPLATAEESTFDPNAPAVSANSIPGVNTRYSPTRPGSTVDEAIQPEAKAEMTPATTYTVKRGDSLWAVAKRNGITARELAAANDLASNALLRQDQVIVIPGRVVEPVTSSSTSSVPETVYVIRSGDTLGRIARVHGTSVAKLKAYNNMTNDLVRVGDRLLIPDAPAPVSVSVSPNESDVPASAAVAATAPKGTYKHVVSPGESLTVIARRYGVKIGTVALANKIRDPSLIRPGQELVIPGWDAPPPTPKSASSSGAASVAPADETNADDANLDAGLETISLEDVPVIKVQSVPEDEETPITTINVGGPEQAGPPEFR